MSMGGSIENECIKQLKGLADFIYNYLEKNNERTKH